MILYPDDYTTQTSATSYTSSEWTAMEAAGCVFLPVAGIRDGLSFGFNDYGYYWSSTPDGASYAYCMYFSDSISVNTAGNFNRSNGFAVRLVTVAD